MSDIKNLIFDFDGTLADTSNLIVATMQKTIQDCNLPFKNTKEIKATIGVRLEEIPSILWPEKEIQGEFFGSIYRNNFEKIKHQIPVRLFPEVFESLNILKDKGFKMGIATSRSKKSVEELCRNLEIIRLFDYILGGDDVIHGKPDPESINKILEEEEWERAETLMIGDMNVDILMGQRANVKTCGVLYGNGKERELQQTGADYIIPVFSDLLKIL